MSCCCGVSPDEIFDKLAASLPQTAKSPAELPNFSFAPPAKRKLVGSVITDLDPAFIHQHLHIHGGAAHTRRHTYLRPIEPAPPTPSQPTPALFTRPIPDLTGSPNAAQELRLRMIRSQTCSSLPRRALPGTRTFMASSQQHTLRHGTQRLGGWSSQTTQIRVRPRSADHDC